VRMLWAAAADMPLRLLRIEPASEAVSLLLNRGGGAKSKAVKVPDLRRRWLCCILVVILGIMHVRGRALRAWHGSKIIERRLQWHVGRHRR